MVTQKDLAKIRKQTGIRRLRAVNGRWVEGSYKGLKFQAQIFETPSKFGIRRGKTSRLQIKSSSKVLAAYDRGWDVKSKAKTVRELVTILALKSARRSQ